MIRPARVGDVDRLRAIELAAGARFHDVGLHDVADHEPMPVERLVASAEAGRSWVATGDGDAPVGWVVVDVVDGCAHLEELAVAPEHQGRGLGRALVEQVERWAAARRLPALTLTTFAEVPWNAPLYAHLGFRVLEADELTPGLRRLVAEEAAHGLDPATRVVMRRDVSC